MDYYNNSYQISFNRKSKYKRKKRRKLLTLIFLFFLLIALIIFFNSSISRILEINISGLSLLTKEEILEVSDVNINMQYLFANEKNIEKKILELEEVKEVNVTKEFPGKLYINIEEYKTIALLSSNGSWLPVLDNGDIYDESTDVGNYPLITKWDNIDLISELANELTVVEKSVLLEISEIQQNPQTYDSNQLLLFTREGYKIHISLKDVGEKLNLYPDIIDSLGARDLNKGNIYLLESIRFTEFEENQ